MSKYLPKSVEARAATFVVLLLAGIVAFGVVQRIASAAAYANPFWNNVSGSPESAVPHVADIALVQEGAKCRSDSCGEFRVDVRTGASQCCATRTQGPLPEDVELGPAGLDHQTVDVCESTTVSSLDTGHGEM